MKQVIIIILSIVSINLIAQTKAIYQYEFDGCTLKESKNASSDVRNVNPASCSCGLEDEAINALNQTLIFPKSLDTIFTRDWSLGFAVRLVGVNNIIDMFTKHASCNSDSSLRIYYRGVDSSLVLNLRQGFNNDLLLSAKLDLHSCWQQIMITRNGGDIRIYENANLKAQTFTTYPLRLNNGQDLTFNGSKCSVQSAAPYTGLLDNVTIANYGLNIAEVRELYIPQQRILTEDTIIFLGNSVNLIAATNCQSNINWMPSNTLSANNIVDPIATPSVTTNYTARFNDRGCVIIDSVLVRVVDKDKLDCAKLQLPSAFTPNGDQVNDEFGISNHYIISSLKYFDIIDRNGGVIASLDRADATWDGTWQGKKLNTSSYFYKIAYTCKNEDYFKSGSFYLLK